MTERNYEMHTWHVQELKQKKWKTVTTYYCAQFDAEQKFFRLHFGHGRLMRSDGCVTIYVPNSGEEKIE